VYPDGGMARLRLHGALTAAGRSAFVLRWLNLLPESQATVVLVAGGVPEPEATAAARPLDALPPSFTA
jgi:allantoicase